MWFVLEVNIRALLAILAVQMGKGHMDVVHYPMQSAVVTIPIAAPVGTHVMFLRALV